MMHRLVSVYPAISHNSLDFGQLVISWDVRSDHLTATPTVAATGCASPLLGNRVIVNQVQMGFLKGIC